MKATGVAILNRTRVNSLQGEDRFWYDVDMKDVGRFFLLLFVHMLVDLFILLLATFPGALFIWGSLSFAGLLFIGIVLSVIYIFVLFGVYKIFRKFTQNLDENVFLILMFTSWIFLFFIFYFWSNWDKSRMKTGPPQIRGATVNQIY